MYLLYIKTIYFVFIFFQQNIKINFVSEFFFIIAYTVILKSYIKYNSKLPTILKQRIQFYL